MKTVTKLKKCTQFIIFGLLIVLSVAILAETNSTVISGNQKLFSKKFKKVLDFEKWLNENQYEAKYSGEKLFSLVDAIDGGDFDINNGYFECYVFNDKKAWQNFERKIKTSNPILIYWNVKCIDWKQ